MRAWVSLTSVLAFASGVAPAAEREVRVVAVTARKDLSPGTILTFGNLEQKAVPKQLTPQDRIVADEVSLLIGQPLLIPVHAGDPISSWFVANHNPAIGMPVDQPAISACTSEHFARTDLSEASPSSIRARIAFASDAGAAAASPDRSWILATAVDIQAGTPIRAGMLTKRSIPPEFATASNLFVSDLPLINGVAPTFTIRAHDPVTWAYFARLESLRPATCAVAIKPTVDAEVVKALDAAVSKLRVRKVKAAAPLADSMDPSPTRNVVVATHPLEEGAVLTAADIVANAIPSYLVTNSWVPASQLDSLVGARLTVRIDPGGGVWWQMLDDFEAPASLAGCVLELGRIDGKARSDSAAGRAKAWFEAKEPR
jgi:Flp pilus assembly protein CpaB